jgi:hypothetical protein
MLGKATSRRDTLNRQQDLARARYQAAKNKARLRSIQATNATKALRAADFYVSRVRMAIINSKHKEVLSHVERRQNMNTVVESDFGESSYDSSAPSVTSCVGTGTHDDTIALLLD